MENKMTHSGHDSEPRVFHGDEQMFVVFYSAAGLDWSSFKCVYCGTGNTFGMKNWAKPLLKYRGRFKTFFAQDLEKNELMPEDFNLEFQCPNCRMLYRAFVK